MIMERTSTKEEIKMSEQPCGKKIKSINKGTEHTEEMETEKTEKTKVARILA